MASDDCEVVPKLNITLSHSSFETLCHGALELLQYTGKKWNNSDVKFKLFTDGITNYLLGCYINENPEDMILVRVYGQKTELFIDRSLEVRNMYQMHKSGLSSPLYCAFNNGLCYGYASGVTLDEKSVRDPIISSHVAAYMAKMHSVGNTAVDNNLQPSLFRVMKKFWKLSPNSFTDEQKNARFKSSIPNKLDLKAEIDNLEAHLKLLHSPIVFCHNDALLKNIIYNKTKDSVVFIDFEYGDYNYQAFDIGNHFCEFAGVETFKPELYPDHDFQVVWLKHYLEAWYIINGKSKDDVNSSDIEVLYGQVNKFALAAHLFWGLWALVQAEHSTLDFDFLGYGIVRLKEYFAQKTQLLSVPLS